MDVAPSPGDMSQSPVPGVCASAARWEEPTANLRCVKNPWSGSPTLLPGACGVILDLKQTPPCWVLASPREPDPAWAAEGGFATLAPHSRRLFPSPPLAPPQSSQGWDRKGLKGGNGLFGEVTAQIEAICEAAQFLPSSTSPSCPSCSVISRWQPGSCHRPPRHQTGTGQSIAGTGLEQGLEKAQPLRLTAAGRLRQHRANTI